MGSEELDIVKGLEGLAITARQQGEYAEAEAAYERALALRITAQGAAHPDIAAVLNGLGVLSARSRFGAPARAIPLTMGRTRFMLARALWAAPANAGGDRSRARALAERVRTDVAGVDEHGAEFVAWVEEWQGERGLLDEPHR